MNAPQQALNGKEANNLMICEHCDTVYRRRELARGETARCLRCDAVLERHQRIGTNGMLALVLTAMVVFIQANIWPIVTLGLNGQEISTTLWGTIIMMWNDHSQVVSILAAATLFFFPLAKMLTLGWVLFFARRGERAPGFATAMTILHYVGPWTMNEVFVLGALVAIVKAHVYFDVLPNPGIFAYAVLMLLITIFASVDMRRLWDLTEAPPA
ncbi:paraquat-inducible protein A [Dyella sp. GSA-30]|uniref:paraquat-inducible protein A n=1 Tax=Dyella sp. GSA-30 TaxID=2994496 RepID=UPI002491D01B|nr:paraquat-inducible protein A [Dyella sp. GSA-30]BDU20588.1 paraquat-inducible protein A [Dyella sp. GSA-30]